MRGLYSLGFLGFIAAAHAQTFLGSFGGKNWYVTDLAGTITDVRSIAASMGPQYILASIHSQEEQDFVFPLIQPYSKVWLGLNDEDAEGTFVWEDGSALDYTNWAPGNPKIGPDSRYVFIDTTDPTAPGGWKSTVKDGAMIIIPIRGLISTVVPEPASIASLAVGLAGAASIRRRIAAQRR
jgi:hypothetical protein